MGSFTASDIKHLRMSIGWSAVEMGDFFNRTAATIYNWENGDSTPGATTTALMKTLQQELKRRRQCHGAGEVRQWINELGREGLGGFLADLSVRPGFKEETYRKLARTAEESGGLLISSATDEPLAYVVPMTEKGLMNYCRCLISSAVADSEIAPTLTTFVNQLRQSTNGEITITVSAPE